MSIHYDVAVIGLQPSGIIAGALLAKRGRRVLLVDHGEDTTHYHRKGMRLPLVPTLVPTLSHLPHVAEVHKELGLGPDLRNTAVPLTPAFQALMPNNRVDVPTDLEALLRELRAEFPELESAVTQFFTRLFELDEEISILFRQRPPLPPDGTWERFKVRSLIKKMQHLDKAFEATELLEGIPEDHPLRELLLGPLTFFGHLDTSEPSTLHAARLIAQYYRGAVSFSPVAGGLYNMLLQAAERAGVEIQRGEVVREIQTKGRTLHSIIVDGKSQPYMADYFLGNTMGSFADLLPADRRRAKYLAEIDAVRPRKSLLVCNLVVDSDVIPKGMARSFFLLNGRRQKREDAPKDPPMFGRRYAAEETRGNKSIAEKREVISVACPVITEDVAKSPERFANLRRQMIERVARVVPYLKQNLIDVSMPVETSSWDVEESDKVQRVDPWLAHPLFETAQRPWLGITGRLPKTYYKNLVHCGRDIIPGLGVEGSYIAGTSAIATLYKIAGKRWKQPQSAIKVMAAD